MPVAKGARDPLGGLLEKLAAELATEAGELSEQLEEVEARRALIRSELESRGAKLRVVASSTGAKPPPRRRGRVASETEMRDFVCEWKVYTRRDVEERLGVGQAVAARLVSMAVKRGWAKAVGWTKAEGETGRGKQRYEWIDPSKLSGPTRRPRHPLDLGKVGRQASSRPAEIKQHRKFRTSHKGINELIKLAEAQKWEFEWLGGGHIRARPPGRPTANGVIVSKSAHKRNRAFENTRAEFKREGLKLPGDDSVREPSENGQPALA